jgi:hypothetical protein
MSTIPNDDSIKRKTLNSYKSELRKYLLTSRFNDKTASENERYRSRNPNIGCIYCTPDQVSQSIGQDSIMLVLEMNNDTNKIMGIGMTKNNSYSERFHVYEEGNYNRYVYIGKYRIPRADFTEQEEAVTKILDEMVFRGTRHMKRGQGLRLFPIETLYECKQKGFDLVNYVSNMFKKRLLSTKNKTIP